MRYIHEKGEVFETCECGTETYRFLEIGAERFAICGKCVCELFVLSKKEMDREESY